MEQRDDTFPSIWIVACRVRFWPDGYSSYKRPCRGLPNNTALQSIRPCLPSATFPKAACETLFFFVRGDRVQVTRIWLVGLDPKGCRNTATEGQFGHRLKALDYFWGPQNTLRCVGSNLLRYGMDNGKRTKRQMSIQVFYIRGFSKLPTKE